MFSLKEITSSFSEIRMRFLQYFCFVLLLIGIVAKVSLRLVTDFNICGGDIMLKCTVDGINTVDRGVTRQWSMGKYNKLLSYNGIINNHKKYEETVFPGNEFGLKIFNVTEKDVNITYRCRYGFDTATYFIKINESVSLQKRVPSYHSFNITSHIAKVQNEEGNLKSNGTISYNETNTTVYFLYTLISLAVILVLISVALIFAKRRHQRRGTNNKNKTNDKNITEDKKCLPSTEV